jgi:hypothetical protein
MWLPKDERRLLTYYYKELKQPGVKGRFFLNDLTKCLGKQIDTHNRARITNQMLDKRRLINLMPPQGDAVTLSLTLTSCDLGRKYKSPWVRSGLWFAEYKDHWFWLVVSFLGGIIGALLVNWLSKISG